MDSSPFIVTFVVMFSVLFFCVGGVIGWLLKEYVFQKDNFSQGWIHPEMLDKNGNIIPDEILAVRFENDYDDDYEEEDQ